MIGRNDPCICGSGKKFKKCCLKEIESSVSQPKHLLDKVSDWIIKDQRLSFLFKRLIDEHIRGELTIEAASRLMDAFIFDFRVDGAISPYEIYIQKAKIDEVEKRDYEDLGKNRFSIYEVISVQKGAGMQVRDLIHGGDLFVSERLGSHQITPGFILFCRVAPFRGGHSIISSSPHFFTPVSAYAIKRKMDQFRPAILEEGFDAFTFLDLNEFEGSNTLEKAKAVLKRKLKEMGLKLDFRGLDKRINNNTHPDGAFPEIFEFKYPSKSDLEETIQLMTDLWNVYPRKEFDGRAPDEIYGIGPMETVIVRTLMDEGMSMIDPDEYPSVESFQKAYKKFQKVWLNTPQEELGGMTPMGAILDERRKLGSTRKGFPYKMELTKTSFYSKGDSKRYFDEGNDAFNRGDYHTAANRFGMVIEEEPDNYRAMGNLGACHANLGEVEKALDCYERSLRINPGYYKAKETLRLLRGTSGDE